MDRSTFCNRMRAEVSEYDRGRDISSAFLIWFIENFFRIERDNSINAVCDHANDKGIDAIYVDDEEEIIYLFQSKFSPNDNQYQGDGDIRNFMGARQWFESAESVQNLLNSTASRELKSLIEIENIAEKTNYTLISVFVTNKIFNRHAKEYLEVTQNLEKYDLRDLFGKYTYFADDVNIFPPIDLSVENQSKIDYNLPDGTKSRVYSIKAKELIKLHGIQDRTLFYKNVRYSVGKTRVNRAIRNTILDDGKHHKFFLYHNGITIICENIVEDLDNRKITLENYAVINGCQSMLTFFENRNNLSNNLSVLVKIIELNQTSPLVDEITNYANNQNSISLRDLRSNDSVQRSLQREFNELLNNTVLYRRKRGESEEGYQNVIEKDFAAQIIEAVYLGKPHNTHLKQKLFGEEYVNVFSRKINAERIYLAKLIYDTIKDNADLLDNERIRDYGLSLFFFSHVLSEIMKEDELGTDILENPKIYVTDKKQILIDTLKKVWELITPDINADIEEYAEQHDNYFDYKNVFKNSIFIQTMSRKIKSDYIRMTRRNENDSFSRIYNNFLNQSQ